MHSYIPKQNIAFIVNISIYLACFGTIITSIYNEFNKCVVIKVFSVILKCKEISNVRALLKSVTSVFLQNRGQFAFRFLLVT